ncbi:MAG TPA: hypothetical protein VFT04_10165 [Gemmatimonadales bacterium]|nr:hypothetical protein [Gemmatimonadales bacterium]
MTGRFRLLLALAASPGPLAAQQLCDGAVRAPGPGGWAEYVVQAPRGQGTSTVRYAIVGSEKRGERRFVRFETRARGTGGGSVATQVLVPGYPYEPATVQEVIVQRGTETPVRWGPSLLARARTAAPSALNQLIAASCTGATLVGEEEITVPAGAFQTRHFRNAEAGSDIWISDAVPFGVVKVAGAGGASLELLDRGNRAQSSVTGKPRVVNGAN